MHNISMTTLSEEKAVKSAHSRCPPSNLKNLALDYGGCCHYESEQHEELKDMHPNTVSGLRVHLLVEIHFDPDKVNNLEGQDVELYEGIEQEHHDRAEYAIRYVRKFMKKEGKPDHTFSEPRLHTPHPNTWGRCDLLLIYDFEDVTVGFIFDWKDGQHKQPDAEVNLQGQAYALGVMNEYRGVDEVEVHFVYTRREEESIAVFTRKKHYDKFLEMVVKINRDFDLAQLTPTDTQYFQRGPQCDYCIKRSECPLWAPMIPAVIKSGSVTSKMAVPKSWKLGYLAQHPDEMGLALTIMEFFEGYQRDLKAKALELATEGDIEIPGRMIVDSNTGIKCSDADGAYIIACETLGLPIDSFLETVRTISVGKLINMAAPLKADKDGTTRAQAIKELRQHMIDVGIIQEGTPYSYLKKSTD